MTSEDTRGSAIERTLNLEKTLLESQVTYQFVFTYKDEVNGTDSVPVLQILSQYNYTLSIFLQYTSYISYTYTVTFVLYAIIIFTCYLVGEIR